LAPPDELIFRMNNGLEEPQVLQKQVVGSSIVDCLKLIVVGYNDRLTILGKLTSVVNVI
jgi:hypothetical protein